MRGETANTSHPFRHFGQGRGLSACIFVYERHLLWHQSMISTFDRACAYGIA